MTEIVSFPSPERLIWVCDCGCSTFNLFSDGMAACSLCQAPVTGAMDGWQSRTESAKAREEPLTSMSDYQGNGSPEFALALIRKTASDPDVKLVIVATGDSRTRVWAAADTQPEMEWTKDRITDAIGLLDSWPITPNPPQQE